MLKWLLMDVQNASAKPEVGPDLRAGRANWRAQKFCDESARRAASRFNFAFPFATARPEVGPYLELRAFK
jgi:hypothetical protein